jgi:hypothetical protein
LVRSQGKQQGDKLKRQQGKARFHNGKGLGLLVTAIKV